MMNWEITRTDTYLMDLKRFRKVIELLHELDKKIQKRREGPETIGKQLHGELHASRSTRLYKKYGLIFEIDTNYRELCKNNLFE